MNLSEMLAEYHLLADACPEILFSVSIQSRGGKEIQYPSKGLVLNLRRGKDMQDCPCEEVFRGVNEMLLVLTLGSRIVLRRSEYVCNDLSVTHGILSSAYLGEDIEVDGVFDYGAESEGVGELAAKARCDVPILCLGIKDDYAAAPGKKGRDNGTDAFARSAGGNHESGGLPDVANDPGGALQTVFRGTGPGICAEDGCGRLAADDALCEKKTVTSKVRDRRPSGRAIKVVILGISSPQEAQDEIENDGESRKDAKPDAGLIEVLVNGFPTSELVGPRYEHPGAVDRRLAIEEPAGTQV